MKTLTSSLALYVLITASGAAQATYVHTYQGANFDSAGYDSTPYSPSFSVFISFTTSDILAANATYSLLGAFNEYDWIGTATSHTLWRDPKFSVTAFDGTQTLTTLGNFGNGDNPFNFITDAEGKISEWQIWGGSIFGEQAIYTSYILGTSMFPYRPSSWEGAHNRPGAGCCGDGTATVSSSTISPANWTINTPVPIPAAAWLLGSGLLGLIGVARRKSA